MAPEGSRVLLGPECYRLRSPCVLKSNFFRPLHILERQLLYYSPDLSGPGVPIMISDNINQ